MGEDSAGARAAREAAEWLARLNSRAVTTEDLNAFYEWRRDPDNAAAYAAGETLWHEARGLGDDRDIAEAVRAALERPRLARGRRLGRRTVLAGGALAAFAGGGAWWLLGRGTDYRTAIGEQLLIALDDGSRMRLNTDSAASVHFTAGERAVALTRGQALFEVAPDPQRPFRVTSPQFVVAALGTQFEVSAIDGRPGRVLLLEGRVAVEPGSGAWRRTLGGRGDTLTMSSGSPPVVGREDVELATSWTTGRLTFRSMPLGAAIAEVNRYSRTQIELQAPGHQAVQVDGVFETGDPDAFIAAVTALYPLRAHRLDAGRILLTGA